MFKKYLLFFNGLVFLIFMVVPAVEGRNAGTSSATITYTKGEVFVSLTQKGPWKPLKTGMTVNENQVIKTGIKSRLEMTLPDGSIVRIAPGSLLKLNKMYFPKKQSRRFSASLILGKIWSKVTRVIGRSQGRFSIYTTTAVAGVRGTTYQVVTNTDKSTVVSVYEGHVGVGPPIIMEGGPKEEISWPGEVSEEKWEEIILGQLQRLRIGPDGKPGKPESFDLKKEDDDWIKWNRKRDELKE